jgi:iron complex transport system substrate-binding protein
MKSRLLSLIFIIAATLISCGEKTGPLLSGSTRVVTALDGSKAEIPTYPQRMACFYNPAYDKIVMLSKGSRIALLPRGVTPWARKFYPELSALPVSSTDGIPDVERLLQLKIDLIFYPKGKKDMSSVTQAGIAAVCPFNANYFPATIDEYTEEFKRQILFFSEVLGVETAPRAEKYCRYLEEITSRVHSITSKIPESDKPQVYYGKLNDLCSTQGNNTIMKWYTELSGGVYLPKELNSYFTTVNIEKIISWNPDIILLGMHGSSGSVKNTTGLHTLRANKTGNVFKIPTGVFCWDMTSCETALLPLFLGKKFHPELFKNWDILKEMKKFYSEIYGITITEDDARRILDGMPPL